MQELIDRYIQSYLTGNANEILACFWPEVKLVSSDFPPMNYGTFIPIINKHIGPVDNIKYQILHMVEGGIFFAISADATIEGLQLGFYITGLAERRENEVKFAYAHFSPRPEQEQPGQVWIARKLAEIESVGILRDINRLELQREIVRLEQQNEMLRERLNRNYNLIATGRVEGLNLNTNPPIFRLVGFNINQSFFIDLRLLKELNLKNGLMIKITEADPVRNDRGQKETRFWMVRSLEKIEVIDVDEQKP